MFTLDVNNISIFDIEDDYVGMVYDKTTPTKADRKTIRAELRALLNSGWCSSELYDGFRNTKEYETPFVSDLFEGKRPRMKNLINTGTFYYHNDLRITSPPPKRMIDYDSGEITTISDPYFLEMKASYTMEDLILYYVRQVGNIHRPDHQRFEGSFNWLMKFYTVQQILFMIDVMVNTCQCEDLSPPESPLDIQRFYRDARIIYTEKKTETLIAGGKAIVRKNRTRRS